VTENVFADDWDVEQSQPGFSWTRMRLGRRLGGEMLGASVYELPPGEATWPYHLHHANVELLLVLAGRPTLRTPEGERELAPGDAAIFRRGRAGAHTVVNHSDAPVRVLIVSTMVEPEIGEYPDSGKVGLFVGAAPGAPTPPGTLEAFYRLSEVDYFDGEPPPEDPGARMVDRQSRYRRGRRDP
jgi:uncharacterized cupin superfamily protein